MPVDLIFGIESTFRLFRDDLAEGGGGLLVAKASMKLEVTVK